MSEFPVGWDTVLEPLLRTSFAVICNNEDWSVVWEHILLDKLMSNLIKSDGGTWEPLTDGIEWN